MYLYKTKICSGIFVDWNSGRCSGNVGDSDFGYGRFGFYLIRKIKC